jgi:hypothetical protein
MDKEVILCDRDDTSDRLTVSREDLQDIGILQFVCFGNTTK